MLDHKQSELGTGRGSYAVILLVLPLGSLTIAKFNGVSVHCFVVALFQLCRLCILLRGVKDWVHMKTAKMTQDFNCFCILDVNHKLLLIIHN